jgi:hypothetical protein
MNGGVKLIKMQVELTHGRVVGSTPYLHKIDVVIIENKL